MTPRKSSEPGGNASDQSEEELVRQVASRAIRRLDLLEYVFLGGAAVLALLAGGLVAIVLTATFDAPFRTMWFLWSLLFFLVPAGISLWHVVRTEEGEATRNLLRRVAEAAERERDGAGRSTPREG